MTTHKISRFGAGWSRAGVDARTLMKRMTGGNQAQLDVTLNLVGLSFIRFVQTHLPDDAGSFGWAFSVVISFSGMPPPEPNANDSTIPYREVDPAITARVTTAFVTFMKRSREEYLARLRSERN